MIRPSHMDDSNNGCLPIFVIVILLSVCFPLGIIAIFIYGAWDKTSEATQHSIIEWIQIVMVGFLLIMSPIISFISLFYNFEEKGIWLFWIITIGELIYGIYRCYKKHINCDKD